MLYNNKYVQIFCPSSSLADTVDIKLHTNVRTGFDCKSFGKFRIKIGLDCISEKQDRIRTVKFYNPLITAAQLVRLVGRVANVADL